MPVQTPNFTTLDQLPSWCNQRGAIDRSACIEIRVSELRRLAGCVIIDRAHRDSRRRPLHITAPLPNEKPAPFRLPRSPTRRLSIGVFTLTASMLHHLHLARHPRTLAGDFRTTRANVMRPPSQIQNRKSEIVNPRSRFRLRIPHNAVAFPLDIGLPPNPNKGASRSKRIGINDEWQQPIRIEKWLYPNRIRPAYFMICPSHSFKSSIVNRKSATEGRRSPITPPLSTRPPAREHPSSRRCPQRCLKLLMVQCTSQEAADAAAAQLWIASLPDRLRLREPYRSLINKLIARYGPIFHPRILLCPRCLGRSYSAPPNSLSYPCSSVSIRGSNPGRLAYGNNPETTRQGWRRRNNKPDTSVSTRLSRNNARTRAARQLDDWQSLIDTLAASNHRHETFQKLVANLSSNR